MLILALLSLNWFQVAYSASFYQPQDRIILNNESIRALQNLGPYGDQDPLTMITYAQYNLTSSTGASATTSGSQEPTTGDPNLAPDDLGFSNTLRPASGPQTPIDPNTIAPDPAVNKSKQILYGSANPANQANPDTTDLGVLFLSFFIVYVSIIKLIYHNVAVLKRIVTEPG